MKVQKGTNWNIDCHAPSLDRRKMTTERTTEKKIEGTAGVRKKSGFNTYENIPMIETEIKIVINRKADIATVKQNIIDSNIQFPVYIFEFDNHYEIEFVSDYEEWELDSKVLLSFPDYEFTQDPEKGRKEIRLQLIRYQSEFSTDGWGRPIENPLNEIKYLIKKSGNSSENFNPKVEVLFGRSEQRYFIHVVGGINKANDEKVFLLLNDFKTNNEKKDAELFKDTLYKTKNEAFRFGYYKMQDTVNEDFKKHIHEQKKKISEEYKIPRKIVRDFINSCNKFEIDGILKHLDNLVIFDKRVKWQTQLQTHGIEQFEEYIKSSTQDLCLKDFKIRPQWNISLPNITIEVKFFPKPVDKESEGKTFVKHRQFRFTLNNDKISYIIEDE